MKLWGGMRRGDVLPREVMTDQELRALVREAVARHLDRRGSDLPAAPAFRAPAPPAPAYAGHASHGVYISLVNVTDACVIEPSVPCEHCGYCKSHGH